MSAASVSVPNALATIRRELHGEPVYWPRTPPRTQDEANGVVGGWLSDLYALACDRRAAREGT